MPRGFGLAATRRANFKMPTVQLAAKHFTTSPIGMGAGVLAAADCVGDSGGFSTFTVAATPNGPFASTLVMSASATVYVRADNPYPLVRTATITVA